MEIVCRLHELCSTSFYNVGDLNHCILEHGDTIYPHMPHQPTDKLINAKLWTPLENPRSLSLLQVVLTCIRKAV